jgi:hypothetical protein
MLLNQLPHLATAKRRTRAKDTLGGSKDSYATVLFTDRACWRQPVSDAEVVQFQKREIKVTHKIYFAADPVLSDEDVLVIGGESHKVRSVSDPDASVGLGILWRVMVELYGGSTPL